MKHETSPTALPADTVGKQGSQMGEVVKRQCCRAVRQGHGWFAVPCSKPAKVQVQGKWYCTIHDPVREAKLEAEKRARWDAQSAESDKRFRLQSAAADMLAALIASEAEYENLEADAPVDAGCPDCTLNTVPANLDTGLCAHHMRVAAIAKATKP